MRRNCRTCGTPPTPYYKNENNSLTQDHAAIFRDTQYAAGIKITDQFVVPAIGEDIQVCVKNLVNLVVGSYIWNPLYGYLQIAHWDSCTGKIGLLNEDINGGAIPGTVVSEGSLFAVTARPCCADQDNFSIFPFLAEDYVIPAVDSPVTLSVTSTYGLMQGTNVRIGSNVYYLQNINSSLEIVVINKGAGGTPGDIVQARDANGELQYLITQSVLSACISPGSDIVKLTGCDGANEAVLEGEWVGQVPVLQDPTTEEVAFYLLDTEVRTCTSLTATLNVLSATRTYTISVADETLFSIGDIIQLNFGELRWRVLDNTTPEELEISCTTGDPGSDFTVPFGSSVCLQLSIEALENEVNYGWILLPVSEGTYISATSFSVPGDQSAFLKIGQKLRLTNGGTKYFNIVSFLLAPGITTINVIPNTDYVIANTDITNIAYSLSNPQDFPAYFTYDCNPGGFASLTGEVARYWVIESMLYGKVFVAGVSNDVAFTIATPATPESFGPSAVTIVNGQAYHMSDNSIALTGVGEVGFTTFPTLDVYKDQTSAAWTAANNKGALIVYNFTLNQ